MLSKEASSTIFWVFGMTRPGIDTSLLNTQQYKVRIKGKVEQSRKWVVPYPTPQCRSYWKGSPLVVLNYGRQLYLLLICKKKVKLATIVEGNPKAPFSIATTPMCRGGRYSFPGLLYFTLDPYLIMLSVKQGGIKYHFWVFGMTRPGIEPRSPGPLANTLTPVL